MQRVVQLLATSPDPDAVAVRASPAFVDCVVQLQRAAHVFGLFLPAVGRHPLHARWDACLTMHLAVSGTPVMRDLVHGLTADLAQLIDQACAAPPQPCMQAFDGSDVIAKQLLTMDDGPDRSYGASEDEGELPPVVDAAAFDTVVLQGPTPAVSDASGS